MDELDYKKVSDALDVVDDELKSRHTPEYIVKSVDLNFTADLIEDKISHKKIQYFIYNATARTAYKDRLWQDERPRTKKDKIVVIPAPSKYLADIYCHYYTDIASEYEDHMASGTYHSYSCYYAYSNFRYLGCSDKPIKKDISATELCKQIKVPNKILGYLDVSIYDNKLSDVGEFYKVDLFRSKLKTDADYKEKLLASMKIKNFSKFKPNISQVANGLISLREEPLMDRVDKAFKANKIKDYFITPNEATALALDFDTVFALIIDSYKRFNKISKEVLQDYTNVIYKEQLNNKSSLRNIREATKHTCTHMFRRAEVIYNTKTKSDDNVDAYADYVYVYDSVDKDCLNKSTTVGSIYTIGCKNSYFKGFFRESIKNTKEENALKYKDDYFLVRWSYGYNKSVEDLNEYIKNSIYKSLKNITPAYLAACIK